MDANAKRTSPYETGRKIRTGKNHRQNRRNGRNIHSLYFWKRTPKIKCGLGMTPAASRHEHTRNGKKGGGYISPIPIARTTVKALISVPGPRMMTCTPGQPNVWQQMAGQYPQNTIPSPKPQKELDFHGQPANRTTKFHSSRNCGNNTSCCSGTGVVVAKGGWDMWENQEHAAKRWLNPSMRCLTTHKLHVIRC